jgi:hypothetical protein
MSAGILVIQFDNSIFQTETLRDFLRNPPTVRQIDSKTQEGDRRFDISWKVADTDWDNSDLNSSQ